MIYILTWAKALTLLKKSKHNFKQKFVKCNSFREMEIMWRHRHVGLMYNNWKKILNPENCLSLNRNISKKPLIYKGLMNRNFKILISFGIRKWKSIKVKGNAYKSKCQIDMICSKKLQEINLKSNYQQN